MRDVATASPNRSDELTKAQLAVRAGVTEAEVERLIDHGVVVPRDEDPPFRTADILKVRVARACEEGGLPMAGMADAIRKGLLSFAFVDTWPFEREGGGDHQTHGDLAEEIGIPLASLQTILEAFGFSSLEAGDVVLETERPIAHLIGQAMSLGIVDLRAATRLGAVHAEALRRVAAVQTEIYHSGVEMPLLRSGVSESEAMSLAGKTTEPMLGLLDGAVVSAYRRQQEISWTEHQIEHIEQALEDAGVELAPGPPTAFAFLDLTGYTQLTEERGDEQAAALAGSLADIVQRRSREHRGESVKWVGDGVMFRFRDPGGAVLSALDMVEAISAAGLPPAHVGVAAGPVIQQGGDFYGRTVNLASRISDRAAGGQVLVSPHVRESISAPDIAFASIGAVQLKGLSTPVEVFEARRVRGVKRSHRVEG
jgi:adenylate cyclase